MLSVKLQRQLAIGLLAALCMGCELKNYKSEGVEWLEELILS